MNQKILFELNKLIYLINKRKKVIDEIILFILRSLDFSVWFYSLFLLFILDI